MSHSSLPKQFVCFVFLFSTILSPVLVQASINLDKSDLNINRIKTVAINDFKDFSLTESSAYIGSIQTSDEISFHAEYFNLGGSEFEVYTYSFEKHGECVEFSLDLNIDFDYYSNQLGEFGFNIGGSKSELDLEYESLDYLDVKIKDIWLSQYGVYSVTAWPYSIEDEHISNYGGIGTSGSLQFTLSKIDNELVCKVKSGYNTLLTETWSTGVTRAVTYFKIYSEVIPAEMYDVNVDFTSISGYIKTDTSTAIAGAGNVWWITILALLGGSVIVSIPFLIRRFSIKQRLLKGDKENFEASYSWSLDDD
ncbi:MAG: hypothetical protein ACTSSH_05080 [Candidatus Heimdallarchaeota archaeon]